MLLREAEIVNDIARGLPTRRRSEPKFRARFVSHMGRYRQYSETPGRNL